MSYIYVNKFLIKDFSILLHILKHFQNKAKLRWNALYQNWKKNPSIPTHKKLGEGKHSFAGFLILTNENTCFK